nr:MAG TPA: hypothetical protein [Caudoviricetes sp.]
MEGGASEPHISQSCPGLRRTQLASYPHRTGAARRRGLCRPERPCGPSDAGVGY